MRKCIPPRYAAILVIGASVYLASVPAALFAQRGNRGQSAHGVYKLDLIPHWFDGDAKFWYRNDLAEGRREFILVEAEKGLRRPAFDHQKLASSLSAVTGRDYASERLPFNEIEFVDEGESVQFLVENATWKCSLESYECRKVEGDVEAPKKAAADLNEDVIAANDDRAFAAAEESFASAEVSSSPQRTRRQTLQEVQRRNQGEDDDQPVDRRELARPARSPDGRRTAFVKYDNVYLREESDGAEVPLSRDGTPELSYGLLQWSPDSQSLVAFRVEPGEDKNVYVIESSPRGGGRAVLHARPYALSGDKFSAFELNLFRVADGKQIKPETQRMDFGFPELRWKKDGAHFTYEKTDRGHQRFRVIEIDARTGDVRNLIDEKSSTFIWTVHTEELGLNFVNYLHESEEIIYVSERDGWRHLYLIDAKNGAVKNQLTKEQWVVRGIERIDEANRQVYFRASGVYADQDPYFLHFGRVNFDGTGLTFLTAGNGNHVIAYSPGRKFVIDSYSRIDCPPVHELRRVSDGALVCELEKADDGELRATGWTPPEVFTAKGRDGLTDIWGIICRPRDFDPTKSYPVIEDIYAGPQGSFVPKSYSPGPWHEAFTKRGFIVVQIDGMGTANRSKSFHNVCWKNLKDAGFPDRILWHQAVAKKYAYYDLSRVGIIGGSAGGQNAATAVLFHPEFYRAAVANSGCHDNRMDKASWNEQWMGYPVGPQYAECSNIEAAGKLGGHLMLIVGELDDNVPPESTLRFADALIKARKDFELLYVPGGGHCVGGEYVARRTNDFFAEHLGGRAIAP